MAKKPKSPTETTSIHHKKDTRVSVPLVERYNLALEDEA
jgi:hypothetical protein